LRSARVALQGGSLRGSLKMRSVVITGASTGIGWATAKLLLDRGFRVFGSVRKPADADRLKAEFGANFVPLQFDVTDEAAVLAAAREVRTVLAGETLAGLVNNAGIAVAGPVLEVSADEFRRQMEVNFIGPIIAIRAFGPLLGSDPSLKGPRGKIVMMSSVAGRSGNPLSSAYVASKHAIEGLSESLRREMMLFGIDVIIIAPGAVKTPIWGKADGVDIFRLQELALSSGAGAGPPIPAAPQRDCIAAGKDRRADRRRPDLGQPAGALRDHAGPDAPPDHGHAAEAHGRPDHRQAPRAVAAGMILVKVVDLAKVR
jgi:NAD(P)-dependent dehydrogenase (short-subunit alcohol dehydrogenase family)